MCLVREAIKIGISRRTFLKGLGSTLITAPLLTSLGGCKKSEASASVITDPDASNFNTRLVLLGTAGGPSWWPDSSRVSTSSALVVGDAIYLIDLGHGATHRMAEAFNSGTFVDTASGKVEQGYPNFLKKVKALFFTHLHMDHTADYPSLLLIGHGAGLGTAIDPGTGSPIPLKVFGPGNRGQLARFVLDGLEGCTYPNIIYTDSGTPTPGTEEMTKYLWQAFAQTINDFTLDNGWPDFTSNVVPTDIQLPITVSDPNSDPCPAMSPFEVYYDAANDVRVSATLVDHHQVFPSYAFRFDTPDGSVVISGDTGPDTKENLKNLASGADVLVHEVIDEAWIDLTFGPEDQQTPRVNALYTHLMNSHTLIQAVGAIAESAGVKTLVLSHIVPGNTPIDNLLAARQNFSGELVVGEDLMQIGIGKATL